jgi:hypothetical protein
MNHISDFDWLTCEKCFRMRKSFVFFFFLVFVHQGSFAFSDTVIIPLNRQYFHDKIDQEQLLLDKLDRLDDRQLTITRNDSLNKQIGEKLFQKIDDWQKRIELNVNLKSNNDKVRHLTYLENYLQTFRRGLLRKEISPSELLSVFSAMEQTLEPLDSTFDFLTLLRNSPYPLAKALTQIFPDHPQMASAQKIVYQKNAKRNPEIILSTIENYLEEPFADSLLEIAAKYNPSQLYSYAQSRNTAIGLKIQQTQSALVKQILVLTETPNGLMYFPFLHHLVDGKHSIKQLNQLFFPEGKSFDSIQYFKLLVQTELAYHQEIRQSSDTPVAMFGSNGLRETLHDRAVRHFIEPINQMHDETNLSIRMKPIDLLEPIDLYFMMVTGENDLYTSSFKHSFSRMLSRMGKKPRGDSLLAAVRFDQFRKFIKVLASYNRLDTFLKTMPSGFAAKLMKTFVSDLDQSDQLEAAIDVADSYASIQQDQLRRAMLQHIIENEKKAELEGRVEGKRMYGLLKQIFFSVDSPLLANLTKLIGTSSMQKIERSDLVDENGRIVELVFFYGDEDGKQFFPSFLQSFPVSDWKVVQNPEWVEIISKKGNLHVYANRPLDYDANLDDSAQAHLIRYLDELGITPSIVVHRGHSYWLPATIRRMPINTKIMIIGSCGGYKNLKQILMLSPDASIVSTKEIGAGDINRPIMNYLHQSLLRTDIIDWKKMWSELTEMFIRDKNKKLLETWENYIPPYRNLGAIFFKAYQRLEAQQEQ